MKKSIMLVGVVLLFAAGVFVHQWKINHQSSTKQEEIRVGVSVYHTEDAFISKILQNLESIAAREEKNNSYQITLHVEDGNGSQTEQNEQIDRFIRQGCNVLCVNLVDRTAAATIIDKAKSAQVPVIFFNREPVAADLNRWERVYYVGSIPEEAGMMQGEIVRTQYLKDPHSIDRNKDGKIQYVMLEGEQGHQDALLRTEYCIKPLLNAGIELEKLANATANWETSQGEEKMTSWLEQFGDQIEVVFSNNDTMALGAISAIEKAELGGKITVVGVDGLEEALEQIKKGNMLGTVLNNGAEQAEIIMKLVITVSTNGSIKDIPELNEKRKAAVDHEIVSINH